MERCVCFAPPLRLSLFVLIFLPVVLALGAWQWQRGAEQARFETHLERMEALPREPLATLTASGGDADLWPVRVEGRLLTEHAVWLDNRTWRGRAGYELLLPLADASLDADAVLVNLGWVPVGSDRSRLPEVELPATVVTLTGRLAPARPPPAVFGPVLEEVDGGIRIQRVELDALAAVLELDLHPRILVADPAQPGVQVWNFRAAPMTAARHRGYAVQWFGLAGVLIIGWCVASFRRRERSGSGT